MHDQSNPRPAPSGKRPIGANGRAPTGPPDGGGPVPNHGGGEGAKPSLAERVTKVEALIPHLATKVDLENGLEGLRKELRKEFREDLKSTNDRIDRVEDKVDRLSAEIRWAVGIFVAVAIALSQLHHVL